MSTNCIQCVKNQRTGPDLLCDECRTPSSFAAPSGSDASRLEKLLETKAIIESGWAGVMPNGNIVDRRVQKTAIPIPANPMFGTPKPKHPNVEASEPPTGDVARDSGTKSLNDGSLR